MKAIGGFFELEISNNHSVYHDNAFALNSGRNALKHILLCKKVTHLYIPYFTCEIILEPLIELKIPYTFYTISEDFLPIIKHYKQGSYLLYNNYFGLMHKNIVQLNLQFKYLIIDNAHAFYDRPLPHVPTFYSPRKFFGIPDGAFVYNATEIKSDSYDVDISFNNLQHLTKRIEESPEAAYPFFIENEEKMSHKPLMKMSKLTYALLMGIQFEKIRIKRNDNFNFLDQKLHKINKLKGLFDRNSITCPITYPLWIEDGHQLRKKLISNKIYSAQYWPNVLDWVQKDSIEFELTKNIIHLPIDQRYSKKDMIKIIDVLLN